MNIKLNRNSHGALPVIVGVIVVVAVGIIAVSWYFVSSLQENAQKMHHYKVKGAIAPPVINQELGLLSKDSQVDSTLSPKVQLLNQKSEEAQAKKNYKEALVFLNEATAILDKQLDEKKISALTRQHWSNIHASKAHCYVGIKDHDKAIAAFTRALALNPTNSGLYAERALSYDALGKPELANKDRQIYSENEIIIDNKDIVRMISD